MVPDDTLQALANAMIDYREREKIDQTEMGKRLDNLTQQSVSKTESGNGGPIVLRLFLELVDMTEKQLVAKYGGAPIQALAAKGLQSTSTGEVRRKALAERRGKTAFEVRHDDPIAERKASRKKR